MEKLRQCRNNYRKGGCFDGKKHSEKEKTSLDSPSPKLNKSMKSGLWQKNYEKAISRIKRKIW